MDNTNHQTFVRIECLKLGHRSDRTAEEVLGYARQYEAYVMGAQAVTPEGPKTPARKNRNAGDQSAKAAVG